MPADEVYIENLLPVPPQDAMAAENEPEHALVARAVVGDVRAFEQVVLRFTPLVFAYLNGRVPLADREDVAQEVFLSAYRQLSQLRDPAKFGPWLLAIARNRAIDHTRRRGLRLLDKAVPLDADCTTPDIETPGETNPRNAAAALELQQAVLDCLGKLADPYRLILHLRLIDLNTSAEIARQLGLKESRVRMRLQRGLKLLQKCLARQGIDSRALR
ncbi:MAG: sigma-70 family RNA polymerase sigma factor [Candidatus Hydrogenedentes bacterium]|nr:sigma-70 family RNA polymerase sigma factor [Candidatus Hydrogenedentota bacterium]